MKFSLRPTLLVALGLVAGLTLGGIGVATATGTGDRGAKACANKKGVLVLASAKGKCRAPNTPVVLGGQSTAGIAYAGTGIGSFDLAPFQCGTVTIVVRSVEVGDTALVVPDYADGFPAAVHIEPGVSHAADQLPISVCNNSGDTVALRDETLSAWRVDGP